MATLAPIACLQFLRKHPATTIHNVSFNFHQTPIVFTSTRTTEITRRYIANNID